MGIFGKIKNILFEPDEEELIEEMPVYTKNEVKEVSKKEEVVPQRIIEEPPVKSTTSSQHFSNVKRDIDVDYDAKNVLGEVPGAMEAINKVQEEQSQVVPKVEEKPSPFQSFDEKEFERVNPRVVKVEDVKPKREPRAELEQVLNNYRKSTTANSNVNREEKNEDTNNIKQLNGGKKPFTPSPVISPVYGILDKNYHKDDIVDRQGGMKREKPVKAVAKDEESEEVIEHLDIDIDSVRKKAYGTLGSIDDEMVDVTNITLEDETVESFSKDEDVTVENVEPEIVEDDDLSEEKNEDELLDDVEITNFSDIDENLTLGDLIESQKKKANNKISVEDEDVEESDNDTTIDVKERIEDSNVEEEVDESKIVKPRLLDDMEKTSTLQILDDIEKELNSIKPASISTSNYTDEEMKEKIENSETLENDLFNLIDSMYEQGEED